MMGRRSLFRHAFLAEKRIFMRLFLSVATYPQELRRMSISVLMLVVYNPSDSIIYPQKISEAYAMKTPKPLLGVV